MPVQTLVDYLEAGDSLEDSLADFPSVSREHAIAVLELAKSALLAKAVAANLPAVGVRVLLDVCVPKRLVKELSVCHIDMNCSPPEVAALSCFWDRLVPGGMVLLDDYAYYGYQPSKDGMDRFAEEKGVMIASLPPARACW